MQSTDSQPAGSRKSVSREEVKLLAISVGVREAARQLDIPESTVQSWSARYNWFKQPEQPKSVRTRNGATNATKDPSTQLQNILENRKGKIRTNLSKYVLNGSKVAARSRSPLSDAGKVKDLATVMEKVWPEEKQDVHNDLHIGVLAQHANIQVLQRQADA